MAPPDGSADATVKKMRGPAKPRLNHGGFASVGEYPIDSGIAELQRDPENRDGWLLKINGMQSSYIDVADPLRLDFEYMQWIAALIEDRWSEDANLAVLHLGGGACSLPRYLAERFPASSNTVVEIDGKLAAFVREWFDLPRAPRVKIRVGEAREVTEQLSPGTRDVIVRDVFSGRFTPKPLLTREFIAQVKRVLRPGGIYLMNCGDSPALHNARAEAAGLVETFKHTAIIADPPMLKGRRYGNIVIAGSDEPLAQGAGLARQLLGGAMPATVWDDGHVRTFATSSEPLTDAD